MKHLTYILIIFLLTFANCSTSKNYKWTNEANSKLDELGLTKSEVVILASIVEKETKLADEKAKIARVYLNRLEKGMMLQSDPTVLFAIGDSTVKRIVNKHLSIDSPYNTYKNKGLPPGPICKPSNATINAVLNADENDYIYFCASPDFSGHFNYAATLVEHIKNAKLYREALSKKNKKH